MQQCIPNSVTLRIVSTSIEFATRVEGGALGDDPSSVIVVVVASWTFWSKLLSWLASTIR